MLRTAGLAIPFAVAALLLVGGAWAAVREAQPFLAGITDQEKFVALTGGTLAPALSGGSGTQVLVDCFNVISSIHGMAQPTPQRRALLDRCDAIARDIADEAPAQSYAAFIRALIAAERGDVAAMNAGLLRSHALAPFVGWIALSRVKLAEAQRDVLTAEALAANDNDLLFLVKTDRGVAELARRYSEDDAFRGRIVGLIEGASTADQERFVGAIRNLAGPRS